MSTERKHVTYPIRTLVDIGVRLRECAAAEGVSVEEFQRRALMDACARVEREAVCRVVLRQGASEHWNVAAQSARGVEGGPAAASEPAQEGPKAEDVFYHEGKKVDRLWGEGRLLWVDPAVATPEERDAVPEMTVENGVVTFRFKPTRH